MTVSQPDIIAEIADFFIRFDQVDWSLAAGVFDDKLKLSLRAGLLGGRAGETLHNVVSGLGMAGGHDKRAGGAIVATDLRPETIESLLRTVRSRLARRTAHRRPSTGGVFSTLAQSFRLREQSMAGTESPTALLTARSQVNASSRPINRLAVRTVLQLN